MNPEYDARGAIQASCNYNNLPKLKVTGKNKLVIWQVLTDLENTAKAHSFFKRSNDYYSTICKEQKSNIEGIEWEKIVFLIFIKMYSF